MDDAAFPRETGGLPGPRRKTGDETIRFHLNGRRVELAVEPDRKLLWVLRVDRATGSVKVERVVCAQDMGECVNPAGAVLRVEGCVTMGLGYSCLTAEVRFRGGRILDENFATEKLPRFSWAPAVEVILVENPDMPPQGGGEPAITLMGGSWPTPRTTRWARGRTRCPRRRRGCCGQWA